MSGAGINVAFFDTKEYDKKHFENLFAENGIKVNFFEPKLNASTVALAEGHNAVCVFVNDVLDKEVIDKLYSYGIRLIALRCTGFNNVDLKAAKDRIAVCRVSYYSPHSVAEHTMALLLTLCRKLQHSYVRVREFNFSLNGLEGFTLYGKTVGIIGLGKIGNAFADICKGFGMKVLAYDKSAKREDVEMTDLDTLFRESDIVSLHCPLTDETHHLINRDSISKMKNGAVVINTSRGALIDSVALLGALKLGRLGGAALDVYEEEAELFFNDKSSDIIQDDIIARLIYMPNVLVTSHQAFFTKEALNQIASTTVNNIKSYINGGVLENGL